MHDVSLRARTDAVVALATIACAAVMGVIGRNMTRTRLEDVAGGAAEDVATLLADGLLSEGLTLDWIAADPELRRRAEEQLSHQLHRLNGSESLWTNVSVLQPTGDGWLVLVQVHEGVTERRIRGSGETIRIPDDPARQVPPLTSSVRGATGQTRTWHPCRGPWRA
jgi:hypothetical protein